MVWKNMGSYDRILRLVAGIILITLPFIGAVAGTLGMIVIAIGVVQLLTSLSGFCPAYVLFRISTLRKEKS